MDTLDTLMAGASLMFLAPHAHRIVFGPTTSVFVFQILSQSTTFVYLKESSATSSAMITDLEYVYADLDILCRVVDV